MVFRFCPQCGKEPLTHNAMREGEYSCPDCHGDFFIDLLSAFLGGDSPAAEVVGDFIIEPTPQEALEAATAELGEGWDPEAPELPVRIATPADGGSAFPRAAMALNDADEIDAIDERGMSLRDWFAGQALPTIMARLPIRAKKSLTMMTTTAAYHMADGMLRARQTRKESDHG